MLLHGIAGSTNQSSPNLVNKCQLVRHINCHILLCSAKLCTRKALQFFLHRSVFWFLRETPGVRIHQSRQILSPSDNPSMRYLLPKFVSIVHGVIDKKRKKTVNDMSPNTNDTMQ